MRQHHLLPAAIAFLLLFCMHHGYAQTLWGTTSAGGSRGSGGNIFSVQVTGAGFVEHHAFLKDGEAPAAQQAVDGGDGYLYGVIGIGGDGNSGVLYKMLPNGDDYQVIHNFFKSTGALPAGGLIKGPDGFLYGTAQQGGLSDSGVLYKIDLDGSGYQVLHHFTGADGKYPKTNLVQLPNGSLYGVASEGGIYHKGVFFKLHDDGTGFKILHQFSTNADGVYPGVFVFMPNVGAGCFYGVTEGGGVQTRGVLYRMNIDGTGYQKKYDYTSHLGPLTCVGNILYGAAGSHSIDFGSEVYAYNTETNSYQSLRQFPEVNDHTTTIVCLVRGVINLNGVLYGVTGLGGAYSRGTIFKLNTDGTGYKVIHAFNDNNPVSHYSDIYGYFNLTTYNSQLYGLRGKNRNTDEGSSYRLNTDGTGFQTIHQSIAPDGFNPRGGLIRATDGSLYGMTTNGGNISGTIAQGVIFHIRPDNTFSVTANLNADGYHGNPQGSLIQAGDGKFYGLNTNGTQSSPGTIFKMGVYTGYTTMQQFYPFCDSTACINTPTASLLQASDGFLYGTASAGVPSAFNKGGVFKISTSGTGYKKLHIFVTGDGTSPRGSLIEGPDGNLYGMTENGGPQDLGVIFKISKDVGYYQKIFEFGSGTTVAFYGAHPKGKLLLGSDGKLYGLAYEGGSALGGTAFRLNLDGTGFQLLHHFDLSTGNHPNASLIQAPDGYLYGTTEQGGAANAGTLFKINTSGTSFQHLLDFNGYNGQYPLGDLLLVQPVTARINNNELIVTDSNSTVNHADRFKLFPNPVHDLCTLYFDKLPAGPIEILITAADGRILKQEHVQGTGSIWQHNISMRNWPAGVYLLQLKAKNIRYIKKIIKQ